MRCSRTWSSLVVILALLLGGGEALAKKKKKKKKGRAKATQSQPVTKPAEPVGKSQDSPAQGPSLLDTPTLSGPAPAPANDEAFGKTYKIKVMVMGLTGSGSIDQTLLTSLTQVIPETLDQLGPFKAISSVDVQSMLQHETDRQMLGCSDESCLAELGGALGADFIVNGSVSHTGDLYVLQLQLLNVGAARVDGRASREHAGSAQALFDEVRGAAKVLVRDVLGQRSGSLAVTVNEEGATVKVDGSIVGSSPIEAQTLAGGTHRIEIEKQGFVVYRQDVTISQDETTNLRVQLLPSEEFKRQYVEDASSVRRLAWVSLAVGVAGLGGSAALFVMGRNEAADLNRDIDAYNTSSVRTTQTEARLEDRERKLALMDVMTLAAGGVGLAATITGIVLLATGDDPDRYDIHTGVSVGGLRLEVLGPMAVGISGSF